MTGDDTGDKDAGEGGVGAESGAWTSEIVWSRLPVRIGVVVPCGVDLPRVAGRGDAAFLR